MALLDFLSSGSGSGGLLDFLRNNALNQQFPGLMPSDTAQYGAPIIAPGPSPAPAASAPPMAHASPLDTAQWPYGPNGAPSQANAQMPLPTPQQPAAQPVQPQQPQDSGLGIGDRLSAGFRGMMANAPAGPLGMLFGAGAGLAGLGQGSAANQTAKALLARGVDPATVQAAIVNPEVMKTVVAQTFGPNNVQVLGNGYIRDPHTGKITRAYEPDDKTPPSVLEYQYYLKNLPQGQTPMDYASFSAQKLRAAIANPNIPQVLGRGAELYKLDANGNPTIIHKNESGADATLDDRTTQAMASQYLAGDKSVMTNLGRGAQGAANIVKLRTEIYKQAGEQGLDGRAIVNNFNEQAGALAGQRTVGTRAANISLAANEANNMIPIALDASAKVPRGQWMPWNKAVQMVQKNMSSPELASFVAATNSLVNSYVRAVSPSGVPTDSMREHAYSMLNSAQSPEAYAAVINTMRQEMQSALDAPAQVKKELRGQNSNSENAPKAPVKIDGYTITEH